MRNFTIAIVILFSLSTLGMTGAQRLVSTITAAVAAYASTKSINFASASSQYVQIADNSDYDFTTAMTMSAWVKAAAPASFSAVLGKYDYTSFAQIAYGIEANSPGTWYAFLGASGGGFTKLYTSSQTAFNGSWHHIAITFGSSTLKLYTDGTLDPSPTKNNDGAMSTILNSTAAFTVGAEYNSGVKNFLNGKVDEVSLWNAELTATDITNIYNGGHPASLLLHAKAANLKGWWKMGEGDTITTNGVLDSSGLGHHMNPVNSPTIATDAP